MATGNEIPEFQVPIFLENNAVQDIYGRMQDAADTSIDTSLGSMFYHTLYPTALVLERIIASSLVSALKAAFPQYAETPDMIEAHGFAKNVTRKAATYATGVVTFWGTPGTLIPAGTQISTSATSSQAARTYSTTENATIPEPGIVDIPVQATQPGSSYNAQAASVTFMATHVPGITALANDDPITGGADIEDIEEYRARLMGVLRQPEGSGNKSDYSRWAMEVPGVGAAKTIPRWNGAGTVKVVVIGTDGQPAAQAIVDAVQAYIYPETEDGKAPFGANVTVVAPSARTINYVATVQLETGYAFSDITDAFANNLLKMYENDVGIGGTIRLAKAMAALVSVPGIQDVSALTINGSAANYVLGADEYPVTGTVTQHA